MVSQQGETRVGGVANIFFYFTISKVYIIYGYGYILYKGFAEFEITEPQSSQDDHFSFKNTTFKLRKTFLFLDKFYIFEEEILKIYIKSSDSENF